MSRRSKHRVSAVQLLLVGIVSLLISPAFFLSLPDNIPVAREEAVYVEGDFEQYISRHYRSRRYDECKIVFSDGSSYEVYSHTERREFREAMESLEQGTRVYLAMHPKTEYVIEVKTDSREILNFDKAQTANLRYAHGYVGIGLFLGIGGGSMLWYGLFCLVHKGKEAAKQKRRDQFEGDRDSVRLRPADSTAGSRLYVKDKIDEYDICYRRRKAVNELVINGFVYDEKRVLIAHPHNLYAFVDGHLIEAGCDEDGMCYIRFDRKRRKRKPRRNRS